MTDAAAVADDDDALDPVDRDALQRCVKLMLVDRDLGEHVASILQDRPWLWVAQFCAFSLQSDALGLKPWQGPPCWDGEDVRDPQTRELADRLRAAGLSIFAPNPLEALARAEKAPAPPRRPRSKRSR
jgi:hypothetical protein